MLKLAPMVLEIVQYWDDCVGDCALGKALRLTIEAGEHNRMGCPVSVMLPVAWDLADGVSLRDAASGKPVACQAMRETGGITLVWIANHLKAHETHTLIASPGNAQRIRPQVVLEDCAASGRVDVRVSGDLFTSYHYADKWVRPFLHPVIGPGGAQMTRNWPIRRTKGEHQDHPHHKSIWVAYGECDAVDNWSEEPGHGWQRHQGFNALESGPVFGRLVAHNLWCHADETPQFEEIREIRFYALPGGAKLVDINIAFHMRRKAVSFRDTKEGGLVSVRVASSMDVRNGGRIENAFGGINEGETWGKPAAWCDYSGLADGKHVGIAVFDHPLNPRYPTGWHVRDYGLMTANCFAWQHYNPDAGLRGDMVFKKGSKTTWRYRLYLHRGGAREGRVSNRFLDFFSPPKVTIG